MEETALMKFTEKELGLIRTGLTALRGESGEVEKLYERVTRKLAYVNAKAIVDQGDPEAENQGF